MCFPHRISHILRRVVRQFIDLLQAFADTAINLCQMSELSLVLLALGKSTGDVSDKTMGIAAFSFAFLAIGSTYAILGNDSLLRRATPCRRV